MNFLLQNILLFPVLLANDFPITFNKSVKFHVNMHFQKLFTLFPFLPNLQLNPNLLIALEKYLCGYF